MLQTSHEEGEILSNEQEHALLDDDKQLATTNDNSTTVMLSLVNNTLKDVAKRVSRIETNQTRPSKRRRKTSPHHTMLHPIMTSLTQRNFWKDRRCRN